MGDSFSAIDDEIEEVRRRYGVSWGEALDIYTGKCKPPAEKRVEAQPKAPQHTCPTCGGQAKMVPDDGRKL